MSRAAGYDSRPQHNIVDSASQQQNDYFQNPIFPSPNTSSNQTHNGAAVGLRLFPRAGGTNIQSLEQLRQSPIDMSLEQQNQPQVHQNSQNIQDEFEG